jgi:hypothetical protein
MQQKLILAAASLLILFVAVVNLEYDTGIR